VGGTFGVNEFLHK